MWLEMMQSGHMPTTRRERLRAATIDEIKEAALSQIASEGASALSIRGVARTIGMSPAGLYRYYDGLGALLTELIADAYNDLADAVAAASIGEGTVRARLRAAMLGYRQWCVDHPNRFILIFGTPIPGYVAPEAGPTVVANRRIGEIFFGLAAAGVTTGEITRPAGRGVEAGEAAFAAEVSSDFPPELVGTFLSTWAHFHGIVTLELLNQLDWIYPDAAAFYEREVDQMLDRLRPG
jgi:AcrR family transcriptional regulator